MRMVLGFWGGWGCLWGGGVFVGCGERELLVREYLESTWVIGYSYSRCRSLGGPSLSFLFHTVHTYIHNENVYFY